MTSDAANDEFFEVEIDGVTTRIPRKQIAELADRILAQPGDLDAQLARTFADHPHVVPGVEEAEPIGTEDDEGTEPIDTEGDQRDEAVGSDGTGDAGSKDPS